MSKTKSLSLPPIPPTHLNRLINFLDLRSFGGNTVFAEGDDVDEDAQSAELDIDGHPDLLHRKDYDALRDMHRRIIDAAKNLHLAKNPAGFIELIGYAAASKVIVLIQQLLICHNYYSVKGERDPGFKPSNLLDAHITDDLPFALQYVKWVLIDEPEADDYAKTAALSDIYCVMKALLDLLTGWLPCAEVDDLRNAYNAFHDNSGTLERVVTCLQAVSVRFAKTEPEWERQRKAGGALKAKGKKSRRGSGLKGHKSRKMAKQLDDFKEWLKSNPINENDPQKTVGARAKQYWRLNEKSMESAAKADGEKRGYRNAKCLADAYRKR